MSNYGDVALTKIRAAITLIDQEMPGGTPGLRTAWAELIQALAIEPAAPTRECPKCKTVGMRAASRCGNCWIALDKLPNLPTV